MKPCGLPWDQLPLEKKVESLHIELTSIIRAINCIARAIANAEDIQKEKGANHDRTNTQPLRNRKMP